MLVVIIMMPFSGKDNEVIKNCVPQLKYISTKNTAFLINTYMDETLASRGYDPLNLLNKEEYYLDVIDTLNTAAFPEGTSLMLTGEILDRQPKGLVKMNNSRMIYVKAVVLDYIVWFPMYQLNSFKNSDLATNIENNKLINLPDRSNIEEWICPL